MVCLNFGRMKPFSHKAKQRSHTEGIYSYSRLTSVRSVNILQIYANLRSAFSHFTLCGTNSSLRHSDTCSSWEIHVFKPRWNLALRNLELGYFYCQFKLCFSCCLVPTLQILERVLAYGMDLYAVIPAFQTMPLSFCIPNIQQEDPALLESICTVLIFLSEF